MPIEQLEIADLEAVSGGMKWDRNHVSKNVIDARGGSFTFLAWTMTYDLKGNVTSVTTK
jgi:hypothetical protein